MLQVLEGNFLPRVPQDTLLGMAHSSYKPSPTIQTVTRTRSKGRWRHRRLKEDVTDTVSDGKWKTIAIGIA